MITQDLNFKSILNILQDRIKIKDDYHKDFSYNELVEEKNVLEKNKNDLITNFDLYIQTLGEIDYYKLKHYLENEISLIERKLSIRDKKKSKIENV